MPRHNPRSVFVCLLSSPQVNFTPLRPSLTRTAIYILFVFLYSSVVVVRAQSATATLSGIVTDQTGAVVPGVNISVISISQAFTRIAITNDEGTFTISLLSPGSYIVKAERQGFNPSEVSGVVLNVNDQKMIRLSLKVGDITQIGRASCRERV